MVSENKAISSARAVRLRNSAVQVEALNDELKSQVALLDDDELAVLADIKSKLNSGLTDALKKAADTVGGFVW
ncbi:aroma-sacti cluster domain-containing protein [Variovorax sp. AFSI2.2]|uniref:aroma-sacti cluster domain-containing protein n=1 Tax=Variovorax sp. AFSI2.2 TaxID=3384160 RepID=UPI003EBE284A